MSLSALLVKPRDSHDLERSTLNVEHVGIASKGKEKDHSSGRRKRRKDGESEHRAERVALQEQC